MKFVWNVKKLQSASTDLAFYSSKIQELTLKKMKTTLTSWKITLRKLEQCSMLVKNVKTLSLSQTINVVQHQNMLRRQEIMEKKLKNQHLKEKIFLNPQLYQFMTLNGDLCGKQEIDQRGHLMMFLKLYLNNFQIGKIK